MNVSKHASKKYKAPASREEFLQKFIEVKLNIIDEHIQRTTASLDATIEIQALQFMARTAYSNDSITVDDLIEEYKRQSEVYQLEAL